jgi:hypothetical protein
MKSYFRTLYVSLFVIALLIIPVFFAAAQTLTPIGGGSDPPPIGGGSDGPQLIPNPLKSDNIQCLIVNILNFVSSIGAILVALMIIYTGYKFVVARGNPKEISEAKTALFYTLLGALILLGAVVIANVLAGTLNQVLQGNSAIPEVNLRACE